MSGEGTTDQGKNMAAIDEYIRTTPLHTPVATATRDKWIQEYAKVGWLDRNFSQVHYDWARNFRLAFNKSNAITENQKRQVVQQAATGVTTEQIDGEPDRRQSDGTYNIPPPEKESEPFFPLRVKIAAGVTLAALMAVGILKKLYLDPFLPRR